MIEGKTILYKRDGFNPDGSNKYKLGSYLKNIGSIKAIWINEVRHHKPTIEQLNDAGWMLKIEDYNRATHKLIPNSFDDDGVHYRQNTVVLTDNEKTLKADEITARELRIETANIIKIELEKSELNGATMQETFDFIDFKIQDKGIAEVIRLLALQQIDLKQRGI